MWFLFIVGSLFLKNLLYLENAFNRNGVNTPRHSIEKSIPFMFTVKIPSPLQRGVDYGFKPSKMTTSSSV